MSYRNHFPPRRGLELPRRLEPVRCLIAHRGSVPPLAGGGHGEVSVGEADRMERRTVQALEIVHHLPNQVVPTQRYLFGKRPANI